MKTFTLFTLAVELCAVPYGPNNPLSRKMNIELNEHVKRKQNE